MRGKPPTAELDAARADVLIVDDDAGLREHLLESLQQLGFLTLAAPGGEGALRLARERSPRLILVDLTVPGRGGWPFLERRRRDPQLSRIPVIATSARPDEVSLRDVQAVLPKPVDEQRLVAALRQSLLEGAGPDGPRSILVVEDDEDTRTAVCELLEEEGYRVARASNGAEAEALLKASPRPDCIILDLWMPIMDGWRFATRMQQFGRPPIPVVVVTAAEPYWGYPVSADHVIRKPLHADSLLSMVRGVVGPGRERANGRHPAHQPPSRPAKSRG